MALDLNLTQPEIISGSEEGSKYLVFAQKDGIKLAMRPMLFPSHRDDMEGQWMHCGFRLRAVTEGKNIGKAKKLFGLELKVKGTHHASLMAGMAVCSVPCSPSELLEFMVSNQITEKMVLELQFMLDAKDVEFTIPGTVIKEYLDMEYEKLIPQSTCTVAPVFKIYWPEAEKKHSFHESDDDDDDSDDENDD